MTSLVKEYLRTRRFKDAERTALTVLDGLTTYKPPPIMYSKRVNRVIGRNLYIPIEVAARDLPHRCRLAADAAEEGFRVIFGSPWNIGAHGYGDLPPGIVLLKSLNAIDARQAVLANNAGHQVAVMSEELIACVPDRDLYDVEIHPITMDVADLVMVHSDAAAAIVREIYPNAPIVTTGTPRADAAPQSEYQRALQEKIVVCMMSGTINGWGDLPKSLEMSGNVMGKPFTGTMYRRIKEQIKHEIELLPLVLETIDALKAEFGDRVIVRPHPVEDPATFGFKHDPIPFTDRLLSSAVVVFVSGCGCGLEAALYGVPSVRLGDGGAGLSRTLGIPVISPAAAVAQVQTANLVEMPETWIKRPNTVIDELVDLFERAGRMKTNHPIDAILDARPAQFHPTPFQKNKFPDYGAATIERYCGRPPRTIGWNMWALSP